MMKIRCKNIQVVRMNVLKAERRNTKRNCQVCQISQTDENSADNMKEISDKAQKLCRIKENIT